MAYYRNNAVFTRKMTMRTILIVYAITLCLLQKNSVLVLAENAITALVGKNISLPCKISGPAFAVYWYKLNYTGASEDGAVLVSRDFHGIRDPVSGFERFCVTDDYSLVIRNVSIYDETTYSCLLGAHEGPVKRSYTDLRVIDAAIDTKSEIPFIISRDPPSDNVAPSGIKTSSAVGIPVTIVMIIVLLIIVNFFMGGKWEEHIHLPPESPYAKPTVAVILKDEGGISESTNEGTPLQEDADTKLAN